MVDSTESIGIPKQEEIITKCLKFSVHYSLSGNLSTGTRIDYKYVDPSGSKGMLLLQDMNYRFRHIPVNLMFRYCIFYTDSWDSRIYTFENDLLSNYSIPALSGEGSRSYLMVKWNIGKIAEMRVKYCLTSLVVNRIDVRESKELKIQFRLMF
jgi:hypothetical protein